MKEKSKRKDTCTFQIKFRKIRFILKSFLKSDFILVNIYAGKSLMFWEFAVFVAKNFKPPHPRPPRQTPPLLPQ